MRTLTVTNADYVDQYQLRLSFSDRTSQVVDFGPFLLNHPHPQHNKYRKLTNFKRFRLERGNLVWGRDWDMIFPISQLHQGYVAPAMY
ncbi:DUF2442 domain-containing protein [Spirosoma soli]|uniref:DUF2442 domain-containing protein n=1 Tax=Spirosoma soli TaxID=1770529 RepID=A0ABW5M2V9_9BACT